MTGEIMLMTVGVMMIVAPPPSKQTCSPQIVPVLMLVFLQMTEFVPSVLEFLFMCAARNSSPNA